MRNKLLSLLIILLLIFPLYAGYQAALITSPQNFTAAWVDLGGEIPTFGYRYLIVWIELEINLSDNLRITALSKHTSAGADEYWSAIYIESASVIKAEPEYIEFNVNENKKYKLIFRLYGQTSRIQLQIQAGTVGATAAQVISCYYSLSYE